MSEYRLHVHPFCFFSPSSLFLFQLLYARLVCADGMDLGAKHHRGEDEEEEALKAQEDEEDDSGWRGECTALCPVIFKAVEKMKDHHDQGMQRDQENVHCEKHKVLLVIFSDTIVYPRAMMIHLPYTALTNTAVVSSIWLDTAAFGTFVNHLARLQLQALDVLPSGVSLWHGSRVGAHGSEMRCQGEEGQAVEEGAIHQAVGEALRRNQHDEQHDDLGKDDEKPGDDRTNDAAGISDEPHVVLSLMTGRKTLCGLQATGLPLDVPETWHWTSHPTAEMPSYLATLVLLAFARPLEAEKIRSCMDHANRGACSRLVF